MPYCEEYESIEDKPEFLAKLIHAVQNDKESCLDAARTIILANEKGVYKRVKFGRAALEDNEEQKY